MPDTSEVVLCEALMPFVNRLSQPLPKQSVVYILSYCYAVRSDATPLGIESLV